MANGSGDALRARISLFVRDHPGVHFRALQRGLGLSPGQTAHHLHRLLGEGLLVEEQGDGYVHYFVNGAPRAPRRLLATLRQPVRLRLALALQARGPLTTQEAAALAGCAAGTAHHHLQVLARSGVVQKVADRPARHGLAEGASEALALLGHAPPLAMPPVELAPRPEVGESPAPALLAVA